MTSSFPTGVNPRSPAGNGELDLLDVPELDAVDPGLARLWAAIVAIEVPAPPRARRAFTAPHRCALRRL